MTKVVLAAVGDISLGDHLLALGFGVRSAIASNGEQHVFRHVRPDLRGDIVFGNLEGVISEAGVDRSRPLTTTFRASRQAVQTLAHGGFNVLNVANNHSLQYGSEGFADTVSALRAAQIDAVGVAGKGEYWAEPVVKTVHGVSVGMLGYSQAAENFHRGQPLYAAWDAARIEADVRRLRKRVDFVVVSCHWGIEQVDCAPPDVMHSARALIDAGADVVLGHHSHIFQAVEPYRHGLIFYSLGNFVFDTVWEELSPLSAIARIVLEKHVDGRRVEYELVPVRINKKYQPAPLMSTAKLRFMERVQGLAVAQRGVVDSGLAPLEKSSVEREKRLHWRKIGHVVWNVHRVRAATWRVLVLDKLLSRLRGGNRNAARVDER